MGGEDGAVLVREVHGRAVDVLDVDDLLVHGLHAGQGAVRELLQPTVGPLHQRAVHTQKYIVHSSEALVVVVG